MPRHAPFKWVRARSSSVMSSFISGESFSRIFVGTNPAPAATSSREAFLLEFLASARRTRLSDVRTPPNHALNICKSRSDPATSPAVPESESRSSRLGRRFIRSENNDTLYVTRGEGERAERSVSTLVLTQQRRDPC